MHCRILYDNIKYGWIVILMRVILCIHFYWHGNKRYWANKTWSTDRPTDRPIYRPTDSCTTIDQVKGSKEIERTIQWAEKSGFTLTFEHVIWKSIGIIASSLVLIKWRDQKILSWQNLVYRPTDSCKTICTLFKGGIKRQGCHFKSLLIYQRRKEW